MRISAIRNGARPLTEKNKAILETLSAYNEITLSHSETAFSGQATELAVQSVKDGCSLIIAIGGDGTVHEIVNGLKQVGQDIPILILPNGTANDLIRGLEIEWTKENVLNSVLKQNAEYIDLIKISQGERIKWCVNIADIGFGGQVVQLLHRQRRFLGGSLSYVIAIVRSFFTYKKPEMIVSSDEKKYRGQVLLIAACNGPMFGDGLYIAPKARTNDQLMHVTLLGRINFIDYLMNISRLKRKKEILHKEAHYFSTKRLEIQIVKGKAFTEADGELIGEGNVVFELEENALKLVLPLKN